MRLQEFAGAEEQIKLCKLISESGGKDITEQANDQDHKPCRCDKFSKESQDRLLCPTQTESVLSTMVAKKPRPTASKQSKKREPPQAAKPQVLPLVFKNSPRSNTATPQRHLALARVR